MATTNLTLYSIEAEILNLMIVREALVENDEDLSNAKQKDAIAQVDIQIREKLSSDLRLNKIDGVAYYVKEFTAREDAAGVEAEKNTKRKFMWRNRRERFERYVKDVMQLTGQTRLEGNANTLKLVKNPPSVEIVQPELVPEEFSTIVVKMTASEWRRLTTGCPDKNLLMELERRNVARFGDPMKTPIKEALKRGEGVPGCVLRTDVLRLQVE